MKDQDKIFLDTFEKKIEKNIKNNRLLKKTEKVLVACSGGKDSTTILYLLRKFGYNVHAFLIDVSFGNYSEESIRCFKKNCKKFKIDFSIASFTDEFGHCVKDIKKIYEKDKETTGVCTICGILKRKLIDKRAQELKIKKIVTGHTLDDAAQSFMMNLFKLDLNKINTNNKRVDKIKKYKNTERLKPLACILEKDINKYSILKRFDINNADCPFKKSSFRFMIRTFLNKNKDQRYNPVIERNIIKGYDKLKKKIQDTPHNSISFCKECGEPSQKNICRSCEIVLKTKGKLFK